jgi:threonylcarbamoyladenosine tRNA methylthiotransferase MtaB
MASFSVDFLGCKVSQTDAQEIRERLVADGHLESDLAQADVAVVNTCCVTNEAVRKSRPAAGPTSPATASPPCR